MHSIAEFAKEMKDVAIECFLILKPNHFCAILIRDTRRNLHYIPVAFRTLNSFLEAGFVLRKNIIKHQWQCKSTPFGPKNLWEVREGKFFGKRNSENDK